MTSGNNQYSQKAFQYLKGKWALRRFKDHKQIAVASASFSSLNNDPDVLSYREEGTVIASAEKLTFYREYKYQFDQSIINVFFDEQKNKFFHLLDFSLNPKGLMVANAMHHCARDVYKINYTFFSPDELLITYEVSGPEKGYILSTNFKRN